MDAIAELGQMTQFFGQTLSWLVARLPSRRLLVASLHQIGVRSLPVIALTGAFIGMVLAVQAYYQFRAFGMESRLGVMINLSMYRELGPVLAATMLAGRVGSAIAAELGTMKVTEQIDALASMGASPVQHLVVPRFLACLAMIPALTITAIAMGVLGGAFYCIYVFDVDPYFYLANSRDGTSTWDIVYGVTKSFFFGGAIAIISCYRGFHSSAGAEGVGRAATIAFVQSFVVILVLDLVLSIALDRVHAFIWPGASVV
ncbi:MAG: ABC transporter permease [Planctomycetota bacterium]